MDNGLKALTGALLVLLSAIAFANPVQATISQCTADSSNNYQCTFTCYFNQYVHVFVNGSGDVAGSADCGISFASCSGTTSCQQTNIPVLDATGTGECRSSSGDSTNCVAGDPY